MCSVGTYTELNLFSGYGGFTLGLRLAGLSVQTVCYVENDSYCQRLIQQRIRDGLLDDAPIWDDIHSFDGYSWRGCVDILTAGFPCQPHSHAGKRKGKADERNLWPDTLRIVGEVRPRYVLLENVRGICDGKNPYSAEVLGQLSEIGYDAEWGIVSASNTGAPHRRDRWWCLAYPSGDGCSRRGWATKQERKHEEVEGSKQSRADGKDGYVAYSQQSGLEGESVREARSLQPATGSWWQVEPSLGRVVDGYPNRVDELKALGNGIVPAVVAEFLRRIGWN